MNTPPILNHLYTLREHPVKAVFVISLFLSTIAVSCSELNRDGMTYITAAEAFLNGGYAQAKLFFSWPFLPILMALTAKISGLSLEHSAYVLNALFMSGACALLVASAQRIHKESVWWVALVVLATPGINEYRNELLREFGYWFFVMLSFWLALQWNERPSWLGSFAVQAALVFAAAFRPEALTLFAALLGWQAVNAPRGERIRRIVMLTGIPALAGVILLVLFIGGQLGATHRLTGEFSRLSFARFEAKSAIVAQALIEYARHNASTILFFGSLALVPIKILQKLGLFIIPLIYALFSAKARYPEIKGSIFTWGFICTLLFLGIFVTDLHFLAGRYVGLTLFFATPLVGFGLWRLIAVFPRLFWPVLLCSCLAIFAHVISFGDSKTHYRNAGQWLKDNTSYSQAIYIDSGRSAFHAGWRDIRLAPRHHRSTLEAAIASGQYELFVIEIKQREKEFAQWLNEAPLLTQKEYTAANGDRVLIAKPAQKTSVPTQGMHTQQPR